MIETLLRLAESGEVRIKNERPGTVLVEYVKPAADGGRRIIPRSLPANDLDETAFETTLGELEAQMAVAEAPRAVRPG